MSTDCGACGRTVPLVAAGASGCRALKRPQAGVEGTYPQQLWCCVQAFVGAVRVGVMTLLPHSSGHRVSMAAQACREVLAAEEQFALAAASFTMSDDGRAGAVSRPPRRSVVTWRRHQRRTRATVVPTPPSKDPRPRLRSLSRQTRQGQVRQADVRGPAGDYRVAGTSTIGGGTHDGPWPNDPRTGPDAVHFSRAT